MDIEKKITRYHKRFSHTVSKIDYFLQFICLLLFIISGCFKNGSNDPAFWNLLPMSSPRVWGELTDLILMSG